MPALGGEDAAAYPLQPVYPEEVFARDGPRRQTRITCAQNSLALLQSYAANRLQKTAQWVGPGADAELVHFEHGAVAIEALAEVIRVDEIIERQW